MVLVQESFYILTVFASKTTNYTVPAVAFAAGTTVCDLNQIFL